jgi:hypothetical protein
MKFDIYTLLTKGTINPRLELNKTLHSEILKEITDLDKVHHNWLNAPKDYPNYSCKINDYTLELYFCDGVLKSYYINIYAKMRAKEISKFQRFYKNDKYLRYSFDELILFFKKQNVSIDIKLSDSILNLNHIKTEFGVIIIYDIEMNCVVKIWVENDLYPPFIII